MFPFSQRIDALTPKFTGSWLGESHIGAEHQHDARECCFHRLHLWKLKCAATQLGPLADDDSTDADCTEPTVISIPGLLSVKGNSSRAIEPEPDLDSVVAAARFRVEKSASQLESIARRA